MEFKHEPIMLNECLDNLNIKEDGIYVDGTLGGAGHSIKILERLNEKGKLIGIDRDEDALAASKKRLSSYSNVTYVWGNHENIRNHLDEIDINLVDGILLDLGVSSYQIDEGTRGFSYTKNARLDMRMNQKQDLDAEYIINNYSKEELYKIFFEYGEENFSKRILCDKKSVMYCHNRFFTLLGNCVPKKQKIIILPYNFFEKLHLFKNAHGIRKAKLLRPSAVDCAAKLLFLLYRELRSIK